MCGCGLVTAFESRFLLSEALSSTGCAIGNSHRSFTFFLLRTHTVHDYDDFVPLHCNMYELVVLDTGPYQKEEKCLRSHRNIH